MASLAVMATGYHARPPCPKFPAILPALSLLRRLYASLRTLWLAALRERATPRGIAGSVAVGVFAGCTPFIGAHAGIALVAATLLRLNRLWALVGSRVSFFLVLPWIVVAEIQTAHRLRTGEWAPIFSANALARADEWLLDWCLGAIPIGAALALAFGALAYVLAKRRAALTPRTPSPAPPPSSESPP
jgi:uncharacterized protein (DUF2062 family)